MPKTLTFPSTMAPALPSVSDVFTTTLLTRPWSHSIVSSAFVTLDWVSGVVADASHYFIIYVCIA